MARSYVRSALKKAAGAGRLPKPIAEMIIKLYAYRGDEPGVSHGQAELPDGSRQEAELILNVAGAVRSYLKSALQTDGS